MRVRFGLRLKLFLLSSVLFTIPWFGYQYVWEMEKYLRFGQEQALLGTAQALATALHERPKLFNNQASFLPTVEKGKDLYGYQLYKAIQLDGLDKDWPNVNERSHYYGAEHQLLELTPPNMNQAELSLHFSAMVAKYEKYLYLFFNVTDNKLVFRDKHALSIVNNDHLAISLLSRNGEFNNYIISNKQPGWLDAYRTTNLSNAYPEPEPKIQGQWLVSAQGYKIELRLPLSLIGDKIAFAMHDVDQKNGQILASIGSANTSNESSLGTILVPSTEIERIVKGMSYANSRIWVVDKHKRVLARAGDLKKADGVWSNRALQNPPQTWWQSIEQRYLHPLYYQILSKPPEDFIDQLYDVSNIDGKHIGGVLQGKAQSHWRLSQDKKAVILSAAYPIFIEGNVHGAVIVEETTNGIRTLRNRALEKLFSALLAILLISSLVFLIFASRISGRIRSLSHEANQAIDEHGRILSGVNPSNINDEIGDLSRNLANMVQRLSQYNHYLKSMASRLSHELRTPIAVVRTSLENLTLLNLPSSANAYLERAQAGTQRLEQIIANMSEATRLEQMLQSTEKSEFNLAQLLDGCVQGYRQIYPNTQFELTVANAKATMYGSPEHIAQLLDKIMNNAVDFSIDQRIRIKLIEQKQQYQLQICNNGPLLPPDMHNIFDAMVSLRADGHQQQPHLGIGLYIARLICEFHQGSIQAANQSQPDGVCITICLPKYRSQT
jgi:two-component system, OmpR family, sensor histidine kinase ChvG